MRYPSYHHWAQAVLSGLMVFLAAGYPHFARAQAPVIEWGPGGTGSPTGGSGNWDTTTPDWTGDFGATYNPWSNSAGLVPYFGGTGGTVTLTVPISSPGAEISGAYIFNASSANPLTLINDEAGFGPSFSFMTSGSSLTVNGPLTGNSGLNVSGRGTLTLNGANTLSAGSILSITDGATVKLTGGTTLDSSFEVELGGSSATTGGGGSFVLDNAGATAAVHQTISDLVTGHPGGEGTIQSNYVGTQNISLTINSVIRQTGATINYVVSGGVNGVSNQILANAAMDQGMFFNGSSYAAVDNAGFARGINYGVDSGSAISTGGTSVAGVANVQITGNVTAQSTATFTTIAFTSPSSLTMAIASGKTVTTSGILVSGGTAVSISGGTVKGTTGTDLVIRTDQVSDSLAISSLLTPGSGGLTKSGAGTLTLTGSNTFTSSVYLNDGTISVSTLGTTATSASPVGERNTVVFNGGTLNYTGATLSTTRSFGVDGGGTLNVANAGTMLTLSSAITNPSSPPDPAYLIKTGAGTLVLSGNSDNSSLFLEVGAGTVQLAKTGSGHASASSLLVDSGATAVLKGANQVYTGGGLTNNGTFDLGGFSQTVQTLNGSGSITNNGTNAGTLTVLTGNQAAGGLYSGVIANGTKAVSLVLDGGGMLALSGNNTYSGNTTITAGTLQLGNGGTSGSVAGNIVNNGSLVFNRSNAASYSGIISGTGSVSQVGSGTTTLSGVNTYSGGTTVAAGILAAGSSTAFGASSGAITATGGTLNLGGYSIANPVSIHSESTLALGSAPAAVGVGATTLAGGAIYQWHISDATGAPGTGSDLLLVNGTLTLSGSALSPVKIEVQSLNGSTYLPGTAANFNPAQNYTFELASATNLTGFAANGFTVDTSEFLNGGGGTWTVEQEGNNLELQYSAVPEPSTYAAMMGGVALLVAFWRRARGLQPKAN